MKLALIPLLLALSCHAGAHAATNDYTPLMKAHKFAEAERLADSRLAQEPANAAALAAKVDAILAAGNQGRFEEAAKLGERCVASHPKAAACHLALGNALGAKAIANGIMSALGYAGTIREAFKKAVELDPRNVDARMALMTYYLQAPAIVGGGSGKARTLTAQTATVDATLAKVMQGRLDLDDDKFAAVEAAMLAMPVNADADIADAQDALLVEVANAYLKAKRYADAERVLRAALKRMPDSDLAMYSLARLQQEQGRHRDAVGGFEQVLAAAPRASAWYRLGQSQQALGDKASAAAAYAHALAYSGGLPKSLRSDAEARLNGLKAQLP